MKLDPEQEPLLFVLLLMAAGFAIFRPQPMEMEDAWELAENFVREMEKRFGPLKL